MWRADWLEKALMLRKTQGRRRGQQMIKWLVGIIDSMVMSLNKLKEIVKNRENWHATVHGVTKSWTWLNDWTELNWKKLKLSRWGEMPISYIHREPRGSKDLHTENVRIMESDSGLSSPLHICTLHIMLSIRKISFQINMYFWISVWLLFLKVKGK